LTNEEFSFSIKLNSVKRLKQLSSSFSKNKKWKILKLTVNTGQVMFSGEIYYY